tara:strand:+ start:183 stop:767 length:585 start_codon:yes stop_codon:yes gene_type:complete
MTNENTKNDCSDAFDTTKVVTALNEVAPQINDLWNSATNNLFAIGDLLNKVKGKSDHGEFLKAIDELEGFPFKKRTAQRLMRIASCEAMRDERVRSALPMSVPIMDAIVSVISSEKNNADLLQLVLEDEINRDSNIAEVLKAFEVEVKAGKPWKFVPQTKLDAMEPSVLQDYAAQLREELAKVEKMLPSLSIAA